MAAPALPEPKPARHLALVPGSPDGEGPLAQALALLVEQNTEKDREIAALRAQLAAAAPAVDPKVLIREGQVWANAEQVAHRTSWTPETVRRHPQLFGGARVEGLDGIRFHVPTCDEI